MEKFTSNYKLNEEQLNQLKQIVPEAFKDNELDFNSLYEALSDFTENEEDDIEQFGLSWPGKRAAKRAAAIPPVGTLVPVPGEGVDEEKTRNIYIEGDNLEVLKIIKKAYQGKIKMIYIDPPYNTGTDLIYPDDFSESVESYQKRTGQVDKDGVKMTTNNRSDGRFHSKWCSMIYPRLRLARELLSEDGVIFISIDDNEVAQLRKICDEIFGENNFEGQIHWRRRHNQPNDKTKMIAIVAEHIIAYAKSSKDLRIAGVGKIDLTGDFSNPDNDPRGAWASKPWKVGSDQSGSRYIIVLPNGKQLNEEWMGEEATYKELLTDNRIIFPRSGDGMPRKKYFRFERELEGQCATNWWEHSTFGHNQGANDLMTELFKTKNIFSNPKPFELLRGLLQIANTKNNSIILDFFSGSATTAHAVMKLNAEDNEKRQFIMVQLPEICDKESEAAKAGFKNICEIGKERIRCAGKKVKEDAGLNADNIDTGFKVFRLAPTNCKAWEKYMDTDIKQLEELFKENSLKPGWKEDDLLTEVMLLEGFPLDSKNETLPQFNKNKVKKISSDFRENTIYICLDKEIHKETINALNLTDKDRFICLDTAVDDQSKITLEDKHFIKTL